MWPEVTFCRGASFGHVPVKIGRASYRAVMRCLRSLAYSSKRGGGAIGNNDSVPHVVFFRSCCTRDTLQGRNEVLLVARSLLTMGCTNAPIRWKHVVLCIVPTLRSVFTDLRGIPRVPLSFVSVLGHRMMHVACTSEKPSASLRMHREARCKLVTGKTRCNSGHRLD